MVTKSKVLIMIFFLSLLFAQSVNAAYSETIGFVGGGTIIGATTQGGASSSGAASTCVGCIESINVDFTTYKQFLYLKSANEISDYGAAGEKMTVSLNAGSAGINAKYEPVTFTISGSTYATGSVGWERTSGNNFRYVVYFDDVNEAYANTLTGVQSITLSSYNKSIFSVYITSFNPGAVWNTINEDQHSFWIGTAGTQSFTFGTTEYAFSTYDIASASFNPQTSVAGWYNLSKNSANIRVTITNYTDYVYYDITSTVDTSEYKLYSTGLKVNIYHTGLDEWVNRTLYDADGDEYVAPLDPDFYYPTNSNGSGVVNYSNTFVNFEYENIYNNSFTRVLYDIKFLSNNTDFNTENQPYLKYYVKITDPSNVTIHTENIPYFCTKKKPLWDVFDWFVSWACEPTYIYDPKVFFLDPPANNWTNGTYTAFLYEDYFSNATLLDADTMNVLQETGNFNGGTGTNKGTQGGQNGLNSGNANADLGNGIVMLIKQWFGDSPATMFIISVVIIALCAFLFLRFTKIPMFAAGGALFGTGICIYLTLLPMIWGIMFVVLTAFAFVKLIKSGTGV